MKKETYQTIALIIAALLLMFSDNLFCQVFLGPKFIDSICRLISFIQVLIIST